MHRRICCVVLAVVAAGCPGKTTKPPEDPRPPTTAAKTCADAGANGARLHVAEAQRSGSSPWLFAQGGPAPAPTSDELTQDCLGGGWTQAQIDCASAAGSEVDFEGCLDEPGVPPVATVVDGAEICPDLLTLVEAGHERWLSSIERDDEGVTQIRLPGSYQACIVDNHSARCVMATAEGVDEIAEIYAKVTDDVATCLDSRWTRTDGKDTVTWSAGDDEPLIWVKNGTGFGAWGSTHLEVTVWLTAVEG